MSIGAPSNLGSILIQRLDSMLGANLGQQSLLVSGAGTQAVQQPNNPENPTALLNPRHRDTGEAVEQAKSDGQQRAAIGKAAREMNLDNLLGRNTTFRGATQSAPTTLGYAARIILALLNKFPDSNRTIYGQRPLLQNPGAQQANLFSGTNIRPGASLPGMASPSSMASSQIWAQLATALNQPGAKSAQFAQALSQSIQNSGLFYESHLARLTAGKATVSSLQQEPQAQMAGKTTTANTSQPQTNISNNPQLNQLNTTSQMAESMAESSSKSSTSNTNTQQNQSAQNIQHSLNTDQQLQMLVRQQLEVLASQSFIWHGEAWPGVEMECEISRHQAQHEPQGDGESEGEDSDEDQQDHWATSLKLQLPSLGNINARLKLTGDQLVMQLTAADSADILRQSIEPLRRRLLAQGIQASLLTVQSDSTTTDESITDETVSS